MNAPLALQLQEPPVYTEHSFEQMERMAVAVAKSGLFGMKSPEQALALMFVAQAERQHPASITQDYDIIQGKATRKTHSVLARFQAAGGRVEWHELNQTRAEATFAHPQGGALRLDWTIEMAQKAGLAGKDNWKNYSRAMLRARVIAEGVRAVYPAAIGGYLVPEEAIDLPPSDVPARAAEPKNIGMADVVEKTTYPQSDFTKNLPAWRKLIESGKKTAEQIVAMVTSKAPLTPEQIAEIRKEPEVVELQVSYAQVADALHKAKDADHLDAAADLIGAVADPEQRTELVAIFNKRTTELKGV